MEQKSNIDYLGSKIWQLISRSVTATESQALILGFDLIFLVPDLIEEILGLNIDIEAIVRRCLT